MLFFWWSIATLAIFLIGVTKSGFGSGVGLMIVPMTTLAFGHIPGREPEMALGLLLPLLISGDLIAVAQYRKIFSLPAVAKLLPGTLPGLCVGSALLWALGRFGASRAYLAGAIIQIDIGFESVLLVGLHWLRTWRGAAKNVYVPKPWHSALVGGASAVSSTLAHAAGPIIALYLLPQRMERGVFVGTSAVYFFLLNSAKLPAYQLTGQFKHASPIFALKFLPVVMLGALLGRWLIKRMNDVLFSKIVYVLTFGLGCYILTEGILAITHGK